MAYPYAVAWRSTVGEEPALKSRHETLPIAATKAHRRNHALQHQQPGRLLGGYEVVGLDADGNVRPLTEYEDWEVQNAETGEVP